MIKEHITAAARYYNIELSDDSIRKMTVYYEMLCVANETVNLTRITGEQEAAHGHFMDSLSPLWLNIGIKHGARAIDVGSGAGFPGIALAIARPDLDITLVDSVQKKVVFIQNVINELGLKAAAVHERCETLAHDKAFRESFDIATARAVAPMGVLAELALPFVRINGKMLAWKGADAVNEAKTSEKTIVLLGGNVESFVSYKIFGLHNNRCILSCNKIAHTLPKYPRNGVNIRKSPVL